MPWHSCRIDGIMTRYREALLASALSPIHRLDASGTTFCYPLETPHPSVHSSVAYNHFTFTPLSPNIRHLATTRASVTIWFELCLTVLCIINVYMYAMLWSVQVGRSYMQIVFAGRCESEAKRIERLVEVSANESLLCSVKVYCDWMRINPHIIVTCAKVWHLPLCFVMCFDTRVTRYLFGQQERHAACKSSATIIPNS